MGAAGGILTLVTSPLTRLGRHSLSRQSRDHQFWVSLLVQRFISSSLYQFISVLRSVHLSSELIPSLWNCLSSSARSSSRAVSEQLTAVSAGPSEQLQGNFRAIEPSEWRQFGCKCHWIENVSLPAGTGGKQMGRETHTTGSTRLVFKIKIQTEETGTQQKKTIFF